MCDGVPFVEWAGELLYVASLRQWDVEGEAKASLNRADIVAWSRPEARWAIYEQVEGGVKPIGGPNHLTLKSLWMTCG